MRSFAPAVLALLLLLVPMARAQDQAMSPAARVHYDEGMTHFRARAFAAAARAFAAAHALDARREILFAQAQATRLAGDCAAATPLYQAFLATDPPAQQVEATRLALARCRDSDPPGPPVADAGADATADGGAIADARADDAAAAAKITTTPAPGPLIAIAPAPLDPARSWWRDRVGLALAGGAAAGFATAAGWRIAAGRADAEARAATSYPGVDERRRVAESRARWAARVLWAGGALAALAAARFFFVELAPGEATVGAKGRF